MFFLLKIAVPPMLVALVSLAARRWGPTIGALLMGLPWMTGPVLFFLGLDKGSDFAAAACTGIELGVLCICGYMLAYAAMSLLATWPFCLLAATVAFFGIGWLVQGQSLWLPFAAAAGIIALFVTHQVLPRPRTAAAPAPLPWWDIPARMATTFVLVAGIMTTADRLGPQLSGIVSTYPAILTVIGSFTHHQWGVDAVWRVLRGLAVSLTNFVAFFLIAGLCMPMLGLAPAFALAAAVALAISTGLILFHRRRPV